MKTIVLKYCGSVRTILLPGVPRIGDRVKTLKQGKTFKVVDVLWEEGGTSPICEIKISKS